MKLQSVVLLMLSVAALTASGDTLTITKMDDIHIANPGAVGQGVLKPNNGNAEMLDIAGFKCWGATEQYEARAAIKIDLSSIPLNFVITKAVLKLYKYGHYSSPNITFDKPGVYNIFQITRKWDEGSANWEKATSSEKWTRAGGDFSPAVIDSFNSNGKINNDWFYWDVTKTVMAMVKNPGSNFGFLISVPDKYPGKTTSMYQECFFHSSEAANGSLTPRLVVTGKAGSTVVKGGAVSAADPRFRIQSLHNAVSIYTPRPAPYSVTVTDYKGRTLFKSTIRGEAGWTRVPCGFAPGVYCVTVRSGGVPRTQRVMVY